jgi:hypothetical protein
MSSLAALREDAEDWCRGRSWTWRLPILLYLVYAGVRHIGDPYYGSLFAGITLGIHELGHLLLSWAGRFFNILGGSLAQIAGPAAAAVVLYRQRDYFGVAVGGSWLGFSLFNLATYIGDARARQLPLVGFTDQPEHDWHYLLSTFGLLRFDHTLAGITRVGAFLFWAGSVLFGAWLCWRMAARGQAPRRTVSAGD